MGRNNIKVWLHFETSNQVTVVCTSTVDVHTIVTWFEVTK